MRTRFILINVSHAGNVGAAARAMKVMGFDELVLVAPPEVSRQRWPAAVEYAAFMIAREAVENAIRHSQATRLMLTLAGDASTLRLDIQDNGCGIQASPDAAPGHLGWASIKERANSIGAHVSLGPVSGGGTCVSLTWQERP